MAFMMPVVKNDYDIYAGRSRRSSSSSMPRSRRSTRCSESSAAPSLSCSPGSDLDERLAAIMRDAPTDSNAVESRSRSGSQLASTPEPPSPKSASQSSLHKFHNRLVDKLKRTLKIKDSDSDSHSDQQPSTSRKSLVPAS